MSRPIPLILLNDSITLLVPAAGGYDETLLCDVRVEHRSQVSEPAASLPRDMSQLVVFYDHVNSSPADVEFAAGMLLEFGGERFEIISAQVYCTDSPHHTKITARKI